MSLHGRSEVHLTDTFRERYDVPSKIEALHIAVYNTVRINELSRCRCLVLLVPIPIGHGSRTLSFIIKMSIKAIVCASEDMHKKAHLPLGLPGIFITVLRQVSCMTKHVIACVHGFLKVDGAVLTEDVILGNPLPFLGRRRQGCTIVAHHVIRRECLGIAAYAVDGQVGHGVSVAENQLGGLGTYEAVVVGIVELTLDSVVDKHSDIVQSRACRVVVGIQTVDDVDGKAGALVLGPLCVLVFSCTLVPGQQGGFRGPHLQTVDVVVVLGVHVVSEAYQSSSQFNDVRCLILHFYGHAAPCQAGL